MPAENRNTHAWIILLSNTLPASSCLQLISFQIWMEVRVTLNGFLSHKVSQLTLECLQAFTLSSILWQGVTQLTYTPHLVSDLASTDFLWSPQFLYWKIKSMEFYTAPFRWDYVFVTALSRFKSAITVAGTVPFTVSLLIATHSVPLLSWH